MIFGSLFSSSPFAYAAPALSAAAESIAFDGYGLQNSKIVVSEANFEDSGDNEFNSYPLPRRDGTGFLSRFWRTKKITLRGIVKGDTAAEMDALIDEMKKAISGTEGVLQYDNANGTRKITATLADARFERKHYHVSFCPFSLTFESQDAFWYDASDEWFSSTVTASLQVEDFSNGWTAPASPRIAVAFASASGVTSVAFTANSKTLTVTGAFSAGDVVQLNGETKTALVNGTEVDYSGTFPELLPGSNVVSLSVDGTFSYDLIAVWRKNYL